MSFRENLKTRPPRSRSTAVHHHSANCVSHSPAGKQCPAIFHYIHYISYNKGGWCRESLSKFPLLHSPLSFAPCNLNSSPNVTNLHYGLNDRGRTAVQRLWSVWRGLAAGTWRTSSSVLGATDKKKKTALFLPLIPPYHLENSWCVKLNSNCISQGEDERAGIEQNIRFVGDNRY